MKHRSITKYFVLPLLLLCLLAVSALQADPVVYLNQWGEPVAINVASAMDAASAVRALVGAPPAGLGALGLTTAIPAGTQLINFSLQEKQATIDLSKRVLAFGNGDDQIEAIYEQVKWTLWNYLGDVEVDILVEGAPLASFAKPTPDVAPHKAGDVSVMSAPTVSATAAATADVGVTSLTGYSVTLSPGHGLFWNGSGWYTQRPVYCAPLNEEDYHTLEMAQYLQTYLQNDGMTVKLPRCTDKNYGASPYNGGTAWWQMASPYWLKNLGYPCTVYASYTGDCTLGTGASESSDDIRARPLASDYDNTNIYISLHTNGYQGDCYGTSCPTGTITYYDCSSEHASWCTVSQNLSNAVHTALIDTIKTKIPISTWNDRGQANSNGAYGEIRIPDRAAILIELAFHDTCDLDAVYLRDNFFRSACMWGIYKGICSYFGQTPSWDFYSDQLVSHDIPTTMAPGEVRTVHVTFRNKGVLWTEAKQIRLGAVGDSDPFTATTRQTISGEVGPNGTYTFTFNLTAPTTPGTYTTDWRMLREGVTWFGATASQNVTVTSPEVILDNASTGFSASANWLTGTMSTDKYGTNYRYRSTAAISDPAEWLATLPGTGNYAVYAWWPQGTNRSASAPYIIYHSTGTATVRVNQQVNGGKWNYLGTWAMSTGKVQLSCWTTTGYVVVADAIKWVKQ